MYAVITKDHLAEGQRDWPDKTNQVVLNDGHISVSDTSLFMKVKLFDDDGELYYEALVDGDDAMERLFEWAQGDSGVTRLDALDEINNEWKTVIG